MLLFFALVSGACSPNQFRCSNGQCIDNSLKCDRKYDCRDGSDETSCSRGRNNNCYAIKVFLNPEFRCFF